MRSATRWDTTSVEPYDSQLELSELSELSSEKQKAFLQGFRRSSRRSAIIQKLPVKTAAKKLAKSKVRPPLLEPHHAMSRLVDFWCRLGQYLDSIIT